MTSVDLKVEYQIKINTTFTHVCANKLERTIKTDLKREIKRKWNIIVRKYVLEFRIIVFEVKIVYASEILCMYTILCENRTLNWRVWMIENAQFEQYFYSTCAIANTLTLPPSTKHCFREKNETFVAYNINKLFRRWFFFR